MDIYVLYTILPESLSDEEFEHGMQQMPDFIQRDIERYRFRRHAEMRLLGKLLLIKGLRLFDSNWPLQKLSMRKNKKPTLPGIDFSLSYSHRMAVCAISQQFKVGIDIEYKKPFYPAALEHILSANECAEYNQNTEKELFLLRLWTRKEAVLKAAARGLQDSPANCPVLTDAVQFANTEWHITELPLTLRYFCSLATNSSYARITNYFQNPVFKP